MREDLLVNVKIEGAILHRQDVDKVVEDLLLYKVVDPVLPSLLLLIEGCLLYNLRQDIMDLLELLIFKKVIKVAIFCLLENFFWDLDPLLVDDEHGLIKPLLYNEVFYSFGECDWSNLYYRLWIVDKASAILFAMDIDYTIMDFIKMRAEILHIFIHYALIFVSVNAKFRYIHFLFLNRLVSIVFLDLLNWFIIDLREDLRRRNIIFFHLFLSKLGDYVAFSNLRTTTYEIVFKVNAK